MTDIELITLLLSLAFNVAMVSIAILAETRARKIENRLISYRELEMYADIAYGYGGITGWNPWDAHQMDKEYKEWLTKFMSYNGMVDASIREDFAFVVEKYQNRPKDNSDEMNKLHKSKDKIMKYARSQVNIIGTKLGA